MLTVLLFIVGSGRVAGQDVGGIEPGAVAPPITAVDPAGNTVRVALTGQKPTLVEFWATWCEYCARLEPKLKDLHARYGDRVRFVAVAVNVNESLARVGRFAVVHRLPWTVLYDASGSATRDYDVPATSFVVVADAGGRVRYTGLGDGQDLETALRKVLQPSGTGGQP